MAAGEAYLGLARKWRPQTFEDLVGQEAVAHSLSQALRQNRVVHGHMMAGPRGVGKTTSARILARALNCVEGPTPTPCGHCRHCIDTAIGNDLDVIEIDAASNNGVDNIRELNERVNLAPFSARHKVYIIDEVHMLSTGAFNALLKTLEEPPPGVVFIFATTELEKVPETIRSRCLIHQFRRMTTEDIVRRLRHVAEGEGVQMPPDVANEVLGHIARSVDGGMRDALMLLDQLLALTEGKPDVESSLKLLGLADPSALANTITWLTEGNAKALLQLIADLVERGRSLERFIKELGAYLRDLMLLQAGVGPELVSFTGEALKRAREQSGQLDPATLYNIINQMLALEERLKRSTQARFLIEFAFLRLAQIKPVVPIDRIMGQIQKLEESAFQPKPAASAPVVPPGPARQATVIETNPPPPREPAAPHAMVMHDSAPVGAPAPATRPSGGEPTPPALSGLTREELTELILSQMAEGAQFLGRYLRQATALDMEPHGLRMIWPGDAGLAARIFEKPENLVAVEAALSQIAGRPMRVTMEQSSVAPTPPPPARAPLPLAAGPGLLRDSAPDDEEPMDGAFDDSEEDDTPAITAPKPLARETAPSPEALKPPADTRSALERARAFVENNNEAARRLKFMQEFFQGRLVDENGDPLPA